MKKMIKSFALAAIAALACVSCNKEIEVSVTPEKEGIKISVVADNNLFGTKTALSGTNSVIWTGTDKVGFVNVAAKEKAESSVAAIDGEGKATFTATVENTGSFFAYYPYSNEWALSAEGNVQHRIKTAQAPANATTFDPKADVLVSQVFDVAAAGANSTPTSISFRRLGAFLKIYFVDNTTGTKLSGQYATKVSIQSTGTGAQRLAAKLIFNETGIVDVTPAEYTITASYEADVYEISNASQAAFLGVRPVTLPEGSELLIKAETSDYAISKLITLPADVTLNSGDLQPIRVTLNDANVGKKLALNKVVGIYGVAGDAGWPKFVLNGSLVDRLDDNAQLRNATFDKDYIYVAQSESWANNGDEQPYIYKFNTSNGEFAGYVTAATDPAYMGAYGGTHPVSCVRFIDNTDPGINGGKPILIASNLSIGQNIRVYAWVNGTNNQPTILTNISNGRRFGDKFSVQGTYQDAYLWFRSYDEVGKVAYVRLDSSYSTGFNGSHAWTWVEPRGDMPVDDANNISEYYTFGSGNYGLIATNTDVGLHLMEGTTQTKLYKLYNHCFGWHAFTFEGEPYLAFLDATDGLNKPRITVFKGATDTAAHLKETIDNGIVVARVSIASSDPADFSATTTYAHQNLGDCQVRVLDDGVYILGMLRGGVALFKVAAL